MSLSTKPLRGEGKSALAGNAPPRTSLPRKPKRRDNIAGYTFLSPWFIGLILIVAGPLLASLYLSFTDYSAFGRPKWVGLENYITAFTADPRMWASAQVTLTYVAVSVPVVLVFSLLLATALNKGLKFLAGYRAIFYLPSLIGGSVAIALLWRRVFGADGLVNSALGWLGVDQDTSWIGSPSSALSTLIILHVWQFGASMVIFLAGLRQVPESLYEAARLDGAGRVRQFISVTLPMISPIILFNVLMNTIHAFQAFNSAYIISAGSGGPADSTLFFTLYLYQRGFVNFEFGYASALGWILILGIAAAVAGLFAMSRKLVHYGD
jgi:multiple sugar transport system permease protein